eukprot:3821821-Rhodomonas_salina.8
MPGMSTGPRDVCKGRGIGRSLDLIGGGIGRSLDLIGGRSSWPGPLGSRGEAGQRGSQRLGECEAEQEMRWQGQYGMWQGIQADTINDYG